ncbi:DUF6036 family nucleotidyltransferase [Mucilaginibacter celer]|uniref:DUF6036 domain-containing protein n=1 Tax=Mucilaginibacter celer TaxID=2305508 RepID=A0A494VUL5_9SPHI|nr:DUF6036 family nucleotidyltransferase [Mucilaginibacter celer]AYL98674.1 hypothetical protein HYN43_026875 [Mucilaginibacter celer]
MGNIFNQDFRDFIHELNEGGVRYILIGGYSVILHGHSRSTGDMDIWIDRTIENYKKLKLAFSRFGMPIFDMTEEKFMSPEIEVFTYGRPPTSIDVMTTALGLDFDTCFENAIYFEEDGLSIRTIHLNDLISAKKASGRHKDLDDLDNLIK